MSSNLDHDPLAYEVGELPSHLRVLAESELESTTHLHFRADMWWDKFLHDRYDWSNFDAPYGVVMLSRGYFMMVDKRSVKRFMKYKWTVDFQYDGSPERRIIAVYAVRTERFSNGRQHKVYAHRFAVQAASSEVVDHKNNYGLDNRLENLVPGSRGANNSTSSNQVTRKSYPGLPPMPRGVYPVARKDGIRYVGQVRAGGERHCSKGFTTPEAAHRWYLRMHKKLYPHRNRGWLKKERREPIFPPELGSVSVTVRSKVSVRVELDIPF